MEKFITDERTGLCYELVGDYYLIAGEDETEGRPIWSGTYDGTISYRAGNCQYHYEYCRI